MTYSRFVFWLKVLLPLAALALLSTLFLIAETLDPEKAIPYAEVDVERILSEQGITRPRFGGVTADGASVTVAASSVRPVEGNNTRLLGSDLEGHVELPSGTRIDVESPEGLVDGTESEARLMGGAKLTTSQGYQIETAQIRMAIGAVAVTSEGPLTGQGPLGEIEAGNVTLEQNQADGGYLLVFNEGVRLIYRPQP
ncbi:MAG: hypothetical protein OXQ92_14375 [Boseongicola sp.]|nr:hypothetical protein [Boseongicola sp.]